MSEPKQVAAFQSSDGSLWSTREKAIIQDYRVELEGVLMRYRNPKVNAHDTPDFNAILKFLSLSENIKEIGRVMANFNKDMEK